MTDHVAIIGAAFRGPEAGNIDEFTANLLAGRESLSVLSDGELRAAGVSESDLANPRYIRRRPLLDDVWGFDREHFGMSPREAAVRNPQHRLFLELAATALQDAGIPSSGESIGVFGGCPWDDYLERNVLADAKTARLVGAMNARLANSRDYIAPFTSYKLDLRGPSISVNTACSTGLVAVHLAAQALKAGECDAAIAGAVEIEMPYAHGYVPMPGGVDSDDGFCRPFDADASGTVFGSGGAVFVLKLLEDALADEDHVLAVIRGSAVNNDGSGKSSFTAPNPAAQADVVLEAMSIADVHPSQIDYVELHATATRVGDRVEVESLTHAFRELEPDPDRLPPGSVPIGSVKANIGHLGSAAGAAGLAKLIGALHAGVLPPTINVRTPDPRLTLDALPFAIPTEPIDWRGPDRFAGVSSFGFGGTNAHMVISGPPSGTEDLAPTSQSADPVLLAWSAPSDESLVAYGAALADALENGRSTLDGLARILADARPTRQRRHAASVHTIDEACAVLRGSGDGAVDASHRAAADDFLVSGVLAGVARATADLRKSGSRAPTAPWSREDAYIEPSTAG